MPSRARILIIGLLFLGLGAVGRPAAASPQLAKTLNDLKREKDPRGRMRLVRRLDALGGSRAAEALAALVTQDPAAGVRIEAAKALGRIQADDAASLLIGVVRFGGPRAVRIEVGRALGRRAKGLAALRKALGSRRTSRVERGLLLRALGRFCDAHSEEDLKLWAADSDAWLAGQAIRARLERTIADEDRRELVRRLLATGRSIETLMPALDQADTVLDESLRSALDRAATFQEAPIREATLDLLTRLDALPAAGPAPQPAKGPGGRYAKPDAPTPPDGPPPVPMQRGRTDTVYVLDATGSTNATLTTLKARILSEMRVLVQAGVNARVGVLLYRGGKGRSRTHPAFDVFPLSYDIHALRAWLETVEPHGVDDRGLRVGAALRAALARSAWRWRARRTVHLLADSPCGDLDVATRAVAVHHRADRTRTRITYVARTRTSVPSEYTELARQGGSGVPEVLR